jgi:hypothetical protein
VLLAMTRNSTAVVGPMVINRPVGLVHSRCQIFYSPLTWNT